MFDWIVALVERTGSIGVALLMLAENVFPPVPSELIMPLAGFSAARGDLNVVAIIIAGTIGSLLGALLWYYIGKWIGAERLKRWASRHGRWLTITPEEVDQASNWFHRHGGMAVFIGRLIPAVRTLISVPAGVAGMPLTPFLLYTILGTVIWTAFLAGAGYLLESQYQRVSNWVNPVSNVVIGLFVLWYIYRVATFRGRRT
ncbi:DedA family protein [Aurantimonas coralicida]|uniref:DedA family protein n=1 Tax=Aurantimonas coralicida TaxID=182270 RepID=UPI0023A3D3BB|nr:DedA family protein [Aurantimonas coralicida]MDE0923791.1 DedA family protein [Aurantimonas coralicida]